MPGATSCAAELSHATTGARGHFQGSVPSLGGGDPLSLAHPFVGRQYMMLADGGFDDWLVGGDLLDEERADWPRNKLRYVTELLTSTGSTTRHLVICAIRFWFALVHR